MNFILFVFLQYCFASDSLLLENCSSNSFFITKENSLQIKSNDFPNDFWNIIFQYTFEDPCSYLRTVTLLNKSMSQAYQGNFEMLVNFLKKAEQAIKFQYYFTQNPDGDCHRQDYKKILLMTLPST